MNKLFFLILSCIVAQGSVNAMEQFPLHEAVRGGDIGLVNTLLDNDRASINLKDNLSAIPLHIAAFNGHQAIVELLLSKGADINLQDVGGWTPLHYAAGSGHEAIVELFLSRGVDINLPAYSGYTPLHLATAFGRESTVQLLLARGADINLQTNNDVPLFDRDKPLQIATRFNRPEIVRIITDFQQRMQQAEQKAQEITSAFELALFDQGDNNQSPLVILPGDGGQPLLLQAIIELSKIAIFWQAREPRQ